MHTVRLLNRPGFVAALARKHNTRAGSSKFRTKENSFAVLNLAASSQRTTSINAVQMRTGVLAATPAGRREGAATARLASLF